MTNEAFVDDLTEIEEYEQREQTDEVPPGATYISNFTH